jgi:NADH-quinone oxidoreductase subunit A
MTSIGSSASSAAFGSNGKSAQSVQQPCAASCASGFSEVESTMNLDQYLPVLLFILVGVGVGILPMVLGRLLGPVRPDSEKNSPYECGFEAFEDARMKFDVRYYLVAILFILFDLEIAFLFPWAVSLKEIGALGFWSVMVFLGILVVGFVYEWKKGALDWE